MTGEVQWICPVCGFNIIGPEETRCPRDRHERGTPILRAEEIRYAKWKGLKVSPEGMVRRRKVK